MSDTLRRICAHKVEEVADRRRGLPEPDVASAPPPRPFRLGEFGVVAEVKRASPSVGVISEDVDAVRSAVGIPVLRKDFVVDAWQVDEARAAGADVVLLIVAAIGRDDLLSFADRVRSRDMTPLVEVHGVGEVPVALEAIDAGGVLGVNARNLRTLDVDLATWEKVAVHVPDCVPRIAESGITGVEDVVRARRAGYDGVLCGEALMRAEDPAALIAEMRAGRP